MKVREQCYLALCDICIHKQYSNLYIRRHLELVKPKDQGLYTQVIYGTLQNYRLCRCDWLRFVENKPIEEVALLLDMSTYQLQMLDKVPAFAIINDAVDIMKRHHPAAAALVNAILRKVSSQADYQYPDDKIEKLAIRTSHPSWLIQMWNSQYGWDITTKIALSNISVKAMTLRVNTLLTSREQLCSQDQHFKPCLLSEDGLHYDALGIIQSPWFISGEIAIQDEASQYVSIVLDPQINEKILDVCSAPGSKAIHIAQRMHNQGEIICLDLHEHRVQLIKESSQKNHVSIIKAYQHDSSNLSKYEDQGFDRVLCDVPCSGYGVLSHKSDIKYHMLSSDMDTLIPLQYTILVEACKKVKVHGILVYSTCTLNKKENEKQIERFLSEHANFSCAIQETIFPFVYQSDGFYIAKLIRNA